MKGNGRPDDEARVVRQLEGSISPGPTCVVAFEATTTRRAGVLVTRVDAWIQGARPRVAYGVETTRELPTAADLEWAMTQNIARACGGCDEVCVDDCDARVLRAALNPLLFDLDDELSDDPEEERTAQVRLKLMAFVPEPPPPPRRTTSGEPISISSGT